MDIKVMCALLSLIEGTMIHVLGSGAVESVIVTIDHNIEVTCSKKFLVFFSSILVPIIHHNCPSKTRTHIVPPHPAL